ncbi:MAG: hypothetical protein KUG58_03325 [Marinosulfonomonas sp.]|nr:hypothetical protein [Marinosulfonomonas sp.]
MNAYAGQSGQAFTSSRRVAAISISETFWGYIIRKGGSAAQRASLGEVFATMATMMFGVAAYCQWLLPGTIYSIEVLPFKIAGTVVFFVLAFLNYSIARKGLMYETQIDQKNRVVRTARRNRQGISSVLNVHRFEDIGSVYIRRSHSAFIADQLYVNFDGRARPLLVASGPKADLEPLLGRMIADLAPQAAARNTQRAVNISDRPARSPFATA